MFIPSLHFQMPRKCFKVHICYTRSHKPKFTRVIKLSFSPLSHSLLHTLAHTHTETHTHTISANFYFLLSPLFSSFSVRRIAGKSVSLETGEVCYTLTGRKEHFSLSLSLSHSFLLWGVCERERERVWCVHFTFGHGFELEQGLTALEEG